MIHRIDRVNPDVDDRVIKPNEARMAYNLRFGASTEDTNLSGGTLVLGNAQVPFMPPTGTSKVVGVYADLESRNVYFALYNDNGTPYPNHGLYQIETENNNQVNPIVTGTWLNFQGGDDYNVSMTSVSGLLYWTDNVNEPRMVNIAKGIRTQQNPNGPDVYPTTVESWHYTQIKRPPSYALKVPQLSPIQVSKTYLNITTIDTGLQYSYYYIYDNGEESKLAPYGEISYKNYNVTLTIPNEEYFFVTNQYKIIKTVVIVVRFGNDGVWKELASATVSGTTPAPQTYSFPNVLTSIKGIIASDITDARYDSVPLLSKTNEIAQNRINHANYVLDRGFDGVQLNVAMDYVQSFVYNGVDSRGQLTNPEFYRYSFLPWGEYTIGVEFVDIYGRTHPISNSVDVIAPYIKQGWMNYDGKDYNTLGGYNLIDIYGTQPNSFNNLAIKEYRQNIPGTAYGIAARYEINLTQQLPDWVNKINIVRSKAKNIVKIIQSIGYMLLWYDDENGNAVPTSWVQPQLQSYYIYGVPSLTAYFVYDENSPLTRYTFMGYVIKFNPNEVPLVYEEGMYITLYEMYNYKDLSNMQPPYFNPNNQWYWTNSDSNQDVGNLGSQAKFKVVKIEGDLIYIKTNEPILISNPTNATQIGTVNLNDTVNLTPYSFATTAQRNVVPDPYLATAGTNSILLTYSFAITVEKDIDEQATYTTQVTYDRDTFNRLIGQFGKVDGFLTGDAYVCKFKKVMPAMNVRAAIFAPIRVVNPPFVAQLQGPRYYKGAEIKMEGYGWSGYFFSMSPRDIYDEQWNQDIGQINATNYRSIQPQRLENAICFSLPFIQGTQVNGLNKFNSLDFRQAPAENGPITSLVVTNATQREPGVMLAVGSFGVSSFYYDAIQLNNVDGSDNVTTTNTYLASQRPLLGQYGTTRPMSITKTPLGTVYWWSDVVNDLIRYTNAGLERLGMTFSFANFLRRTYNNQPLIITWYDQVTDEIGLYSPGPRASVFSERYKTFQGIREYPAYINRAIGTATKQFMFRGGEIWVTDVEADPITGPGNNQFFGTYVEPQLDIVTNENPSIVKRWNQVKIYGSKPSVVYFEAPSETDPAYMLSSYLDKNLFVQRKNDWEGAIRRADNTPGGVIAGKLMESRILISKFAWKAEGFQKLNFIEVKSNVSIVQ